MTRESIYAALMARFQTLVPNGSLQGVNYTTSDVLTSSQLRTVSRKLQHWDGLPLEMQPALFIPQGQEHRTQKRGFPPSITIALIMMLSVKTAASIDSTAVPSVILNTLLDAIDAAIAAKEPVDYSSELVNTLGGLVYECKIVGTTETSEGTLDDQEVAFIPVEIVVPTLT